MFHLFCDIISPINYKTCRLLNITCRNIIIYNTKKQSLCCCHVPIEKFWYLSRANICTIVRFSRILKFKNNSTSKRIQ